MRSNTLTRPPLHLPHLQIVCVHDPAPVKAIQHRCVKARVRQHTTFPAAPFTCTAMSSPMAWHMTARSLGVCTSKVTKANIQQCIPPFQQRSRRTTLPCSPESSGSSASSQSGGSRPPQNRNFCTTATTHEVSSSPQPQPPSRRRAARRQRAASGPPSLTIWSRFVYHKM